MSNPRSNIDWSTDWSQSDVGAERDARPFPWAQTLICSVLAAIIYEHIATIRPRTFTIVDDAGSLTTTVSST